MLYKFSSSSPYDPAVGASVYVPSRFVQYFDCLRPKFRLILFLLALVLALYFIWRNESAHFVNKSIIQIGIWLGLVTVL